MPPRASPPSRAIHEDYETNIVTWKRAEIISGLDGKLRRVRPLRTIEGHRAAAEAVAALMDRTFERIDPAELCETWKQTGGRSDDLWGSSRQADTRVHGGPDPGDALV